MTGFVPAPGSVLSLTPAEGQVRFEDLEHSGPGPAPTFTLPLIGWGIVATERDFSVVTTELQPIVIDSDGHPVPASQVPEQHDQRLAWAVLY